MRRLTLLFIVILIAISPAWGEEVTPQSSNEDVNWLDRSHDALLFRTQKAAAWFDQFFGDRRDQDEAATMRTRITVGWEFSEHGGNDTDARVRVKVRLPKLKEQFDLLLSNEEVDDYNLLPLEGNRPQQPADTTDDNYNAALRWTKLSTLKETMDLRVGVHSGPDIYLMGRHRRQHNFSNNTKLQLTPSVFLDTRDGVGGRLLAELDYQFDHPGAIRLSGRGQVTDRENGLEWRGGLSYMHRLSSKGAIVSGFYLSGEPDSDYDVDSYSVSIRLRNQFWRHYLFYEIEPFINWPAEENYRSNLGLTLSLKMVIGK